MVQTEPKGAERHGQQAPDQPSTGDTGVRQAEHDGQGENLTAQAVDPTIRVGDELSDARWFSAGEIVDGLAARTLVLPPRLSVSHELIAHWLRERGVELADVLGDEPWLRPRA